MRSDELPLFLDDDTAPWLLVPPDVRCALRAMQAAGKCLALTPGLKVHRGVFTGANDVFLITDVEPKLGGLAHVTFEPREAGGKGEAAYIEDEVLRPLVRGQDIRAWSHTSERALVFCHDERDGRPIAAPKRVQRYLQRHASRLRVRAEWKSSLPLGTIFRVAAHTFGYRIAWHDLASDLKAVALPTTIDIWGKPRALIPLNTVYYLKPRTEDQAYLLTAYLNSLPVRTFARATAERAKDAHFRFFATTIGCLPLPYRWELFKADELVRISRDAHTRGCIQPDEQARLDDIVCQAYSLNTGMRDAIAGYDLWLRGKET